MTEVFKIDINKPIKSFKIGGIDLEADVSDHAIKELLELQNSGLREEAAEVGKRITDLDIEEITGDVFTQLVDDQVDIYNRLYFPVFGDGFKQVYDATNNFRGVTLAFEQAFQHITQEIQDENNRVRKENKNKYIKS